MNRYYSNNSVTITSDEENFELSCNSLDVQNTGTSFCTFDGIYIAPGTGRTFPFELGGDVIIYNKIIRIQFDGGTGNLIVNQISYLNK
jgi:hypothetical protein